MALDCIYTYTPVSALWNKQISLLKWQGMPAVRTLKRVEQLLENSCCFTGQTVEIEQRNTKRQQKKNKVENAYNRRTRLYTHHLTLKPDVHSIE